MNGINIESMDFDFSLIHSGPQKDLFLSELKHELDMNN